MDFNLDKEVIWMINTSSKKLEAFFEDLQDMLEVKDTKKLKRIHKYTNKVEVIKAETILNELELSHDLGYAQIDMELVQVCRDLC